MEKEELIYKIDIPNRYKDNKVYLIHIDNGMYKLYMENVNYVSITKNNDDSIKFIDPEGGEPICVGHVYSGQIVTEIIWDDVCNCYFVIMKK